MMTTVRNVLTGRTDEMIFSTVRHKSLIYMDAMCNPGLRVVDLDTLELRQCGTTCGKVLAVCDDCIYFNSCSCGPYSYYSGDIFSLRGNRKRYLGFHWRVRHATINATGTRLYTVGGNVVKVWDLVSFCNVQTVHDEAQCLVLHPSGTRLFTGSSTSLRVWGIDHDGRLALQTQRNCAVAFMALSADGNTLVTGRSHFNLWDTGTMRSLRQIPANYSHYMSVSDLHIHDNKIVFFSGDDVFVLDLTATTKKNCLRIPVRATPLAARWKGFGLQVTSCVGQTMYVPNKRIQDVVSRAFRRELAAMILSYM